MQPSHIDLRSTLSSAQRPSLICDLATLQGLRGLDRTAGRRGRLAARMVAEATAMAALPLPTREMEGIRLLNVARSVIRRVLTTALAWAISGDERHLTTARCTMRAVANFADWNPAHFLDVAEMATALALGLDLLHQALEDHEREHIIQALINHALQPGQEDAWWVRGHNNWNQVCHGGLTLAALMVHNHAPDLAQATIERSLTCMASGLMAYAPDGVYPEGSIYWEYGTIYSVITCAALMRALDHDGGISSAPGFAASADFIMHAQGPSGLPFNFSDCGRGIIKIPSPSLFWFAQHFSRPDLVHHDLISLDRLLQLPIRVEGFNHRFLPLLLLWMRDEVVAPKLPTSWSGAGINSVAIHRSSWDATATWLAVKGGTPSAPHGHMDAGSLVVEMAGQRWIEDLGAENYHALEQAGIAIWDNSADGQRWSVLRHHNRAHSTLTVDDQGQVVNGNARIVRHYCDGPERFSILDLSPVYAGQLKQAQRGVRLQADGSVIIRDEFRAPAGRSISAGLPTAATVHVLSQQLLLLELNGTQAWLHIDAPHTACWRLSELQPQRSCEQGNHDITRCAVDLISDGSEQVIQISLHADKPTQSIIQALARW